MTNGSWWMSSVAVALGGVSVLLLLVGPAALIQPAEAHRAVPASWSFPFFFKSETPVASSPLNVPDADSHAAPVVVVKSAVGNPPPPMYLDSFFPAAMQLLHYYSERMQYTELHSTTVAPPYTGGDYGGPVTSAPAAVPAAPITTTTTTPRPTTTTRPPTTTTPPRVESTTQAHAPGLFAPVPPQYQMQLDEQSPHRPPPQRTTTRLPPWTTTTRPRITTRTTRKAATTWWPTTQRTTTKRRFELATTARPPTTTTRRPTQWSTKRPGNASPDGFFQWFFENKPQIIKQRHGKEIISYDLLDPLPRDLLNDIEAEGPGLPALNDDDNAIEFLKKYDDTFGRFVPSQTGNRRQPPTKPFVEFLVLYDLMKREAKVKMFNDYHGYTDALLKSLYDSSFLSSERQLHYVFSQVKARNEAESAGIKVRMDSIIKDLENPHSVTSQTMRTIPTFIFAL